MIDISKGRYWDEGIQLIDGCTPCSPGCRNCWSAAMAHRFRRGICFDGKVDLSVTNYTDKNGKFNGRIRCNPDRLARFNTRKSKVFAIWNDLFHEGVPDSFIHETIGNMTRDCVSKNDFLILTKRPERMLKIISTIKKCEGGWWTHNGAWPKSYEGQNKKGIEPGLIISWSKDFPPDNIYFGLTVCNQQEADEKIPIFLQVPGKKFLSIEPMLGEIDTRGLLWRYSEVPTPNGFGLVRIPLIDAVILGGETGSGARPMHPGWVRSVRDQCVAAGVPFFFKFWGKYWKTLPGENTDDPKSRLLNGKEYNELPWVKIG